MLLSLAVLGVVYGDIGISPLYALHECFHGPHAIAATPANVLGVLGSRLTVAQATHMAGRSGDPFRQPPWPTTQ